VHFPSLFDRAERVNNKATTPELPDRTFKKFYSSEYGVVGRRRKKDTQRVEAIRDTVVCFLSL